MTKSRIIPKGVPYTQIADTVVVDTRIRASTFRVYCYLMMRANAEGRTWPGYRRITKELGVSMSSVARAVKTLEATGWVKVYRNREDGRQAPNIYTVHGQVTGLTSAPPVKRVAKLDPSSLTTGQVVRIETSNCEHPTWAVAKDGAQICTSCLLERTG